MWHVVSMAISADMSPCCSAASARAAVHVVGWACSAGRRAGDLQCRLPGCCRPPVGLLRISSRRLRACPEERELAGDRIQTVRWSGNVVAAAQPIPGSWTGVAYPGGGHSGDVCYLEARPFFWDCRAAAYDI